MCGGHPLSDEQGSRAVIGTQQSFRKRISLNAEIAIFNSIKEHMTHTLMKIKDYMN